MLESVALGLLKWNDCLQDIVARIEESQVLAGCCQARYSHVQPLSNASQAFDTQWPCAQYGSGANGRQGWPTPTPVGAPAKGDLQAN